MVRSFLITLVAIVLSACASTPLYTEKSGEEPHGYNTFELGEDHYLVTYQTYRSISFEEVDDLALRRAAELTAEKGASGFDVVEKKSGFKRESREHRYVSATVLGDNQALLSPTYWEEMTIKQVSFEIKLVRDSANTDQ